MSRNRLSGVFGAVLAGILVMLPAASSAGEVDQSAIVGGMIVYLGVVPATMLSEHPNVYGKHNAQCPVPGGSRSFHVMVAIFDKSSGRRITDADVTARVSPLGLVGREKRLGPVTVADVVAYCNYFKLSTNDTYHIKVEIRRPNAPDAVHAKFAYKLFRQ